MGLNMLTPTEEDDVGEAQIQSMSDLIVTLGKAFDGFGETLLAAGESLRRDFDDLISEYGVLLETRGVELLVMASEYGELDEKHRRSDLEKVKLSKKLTALETKYKYEMLKTHEVGEKCARLEVRIELVEREKKRAEMKFREVEERVAFVVSEKAKIEKDHAFVLDCYQFEKNERVMVEERCKMMEEKHEVEVEEKRRVERRYAELEERYELERLERLNVEHELKVLDEKHGLVVEELRGFEKKCEELEGRNEILMLEKLNAEDECRGIEEKKRLEVEGRRKVEKEYAELWEKQKSELLEKVKVEIMYKELQEKYRKVEREYKLLDEKHDFDMLERIQMEKECKEVAEKYRVEAVKRRKFEEKYDDLEKKYTDAMMEILKEYSAIHEKLKFEQQEKLKLQRECEELREKIEGLRDQESNDKKYGDLQEKYEFERLENLKIQNEYKDLWEIHRLELRAKIKAENDLRECLARLDKLKEDIIGASGRYDSLLEDVRKGKKAEDDRSDKKPRDSSHDHVIDLEDIQDFMPASEVSPQNGGLHSSGTRKFASGGSILISDSDDDYSPGEMKQMGLKRKRGSSPNNTNNGNRADNLEQDTTPTAEMRQHRRLRRCDSLVNYLSEPVASSAVSDYGKHKNSSSHGHIILETKEKPRGTQKVQIGPPAMTSKEPIDCESDDSSTSISSSDDSEDEEELQSMINAVLEKAKA